MWEKIGIGEIIILCTVLYGIWKRLNPTKSYNEQLREKMEKKNGDDSASNKEF